MTIGFFERFPGQENVAASVALVMRDLGVTPEEALAAYDEWLAERMAEMVPGSPRRSASRSGGARPLLRGGSRHRAGDSASLPGACPRCGATVEMLQLCHISSPVWRTQLACMADGCAWHGKSRLPIDALLARGAANLKNNVTEG